MKVIILAAAAVTAPMAALAQGACGFFEAVEPGDDLATVAARCGVSEEVLREANPELDPAGLEAGAVLALDPSRPLESAAGSSGAARAAYLADYIGEWAASETCEANVWSLQADRVESEGEICDIDGIAPAGSGISVMLACKSGQRTVELGLAASDVLTAGEAVLRRCTR